MVIAKMQEPPDVLGYRARLKFYNEKGAEVESEAQAARTLINSIIEDTSTIGQRSPGAHRQPD